MNLTFKLISDFKELEPWRIRISGLEKTSSLPENFTIQYLASWWSDYGRRKGGRFGSGQQLFIVLLFDNGELRGILPMELIKKTKKGILPVKELVFLSQPFGGPIMDVIGEGIGEPGVKGLIAFIRKHISFDLLNFSYLPAESVFCRAFNNDIHQHSGMPVISIDQPYEELRMQSYSRNLRSNITKFTRRIREREQTDIRGRVLLGKDAILPYKQKIYAASNSKLLSKNMHSIYLDESGDKYFDYLISKELPYCSIFEDDQMILGYNFGYIQGDTVKYLDGAYNRTYSESLKIGFGILALDQAVREFAGKYRSFNLGHGLGSYKLQFTREIIKTYSLILKGNTLLSSLWYKKTVARFKGSDAIPDTGTDDKDVNQQSNQ